MFTLSSFVNYKVLVYSSISDLTAEHLKPDSLKLH